MKTQDKQTIRAFILKLLYDEDVRHKLDSIQGLEADPFEAMLFYEQEVERINKMFCYPTMPTQDTATNHPRRMVP
jgi:hypothetical protein